jgi:uncharacterized membrane protein
MSDRNLVGLMYFLHALAPFSAWILAIVAIIIGMVKRPDVKDTYLESHVAWLSRTFWLGLAWILGCLVVSVILAVTLIGIALIWLPWALLFLWYLYRVIKGWLRLNDGLPAE